MLQNLFESIRKSGQPILDGFSDAEDVFESFNLPSGERKGLEIIFGIYEIDGYDGSATVFFYDSNVGKYYETYGGHCSCYGLEDQWSANEICLKELETRLKNNDFFGSYQLAAALR